MLVIVSVGKGGSGGWGGGGGGRRDAMQGNGKIKGRTLSYAKIMV